MVNYKVEGEINFYDELKKSLNVEDNYSENRCLITNTILVEPFVKLECGHTFNYLPLYKDALNHKNKFNSMELGCILKNGQMRCPYCRNIQNSLLPYFYIEGVEKIHGINFIDENFHKYNNFFYGECCYSCSNPNYDENVEENQESNSKIIKCENKNVTKLKENGKDYCHYHKYLIYKQVLKEEKVKAKQLEKEKKLFIKQLEKEEKVKAKQLQKEKKKNDLLLCDAILKSGSNKGLPCCKKAFENNKCKRHL